MRHRSAKKCQKLEERREPKEPKKVGFRAVERQKRRILQLEQLVGRQVAELDFFAAALRNIVESRPKSGDDSGNESAPRSKPPSARPLSVEWMCQAVGVSRAEFYRDWQEPNPQDAEMTIRDAVQKAGTGLPPLWETAGYWRWCGEAVSRWANGWSGESCAPTY